MTVVSLEANSFPLHQHDVASPQADEQQEDPEIAELKNEVNELKKAVTALKEQREQNEALDEAAQTDELDALMELQVGEEQGPQPVAIHGFFDLSYFKFFFDDGSPYAIYAPGNWSFIMSNINLYFSGQMTPTLGSLIEVKLSFLPHGMEDDTESYGIIGDTVIDSGVEYVRYNTEVRDPHLTTHWNYGSITVVRAHFTYSPFDWLNILAGRFLTPYGIWNIDHGSPVILTVHEPYMQLREMLPLAQTGLQIYGRFFPTYELFLEYALTISNGRGPIEELIDLDENKGVGLRLRLLYEGVDWGVSLGGYAYYGKYTDLKKASILALNPDLTINTEADVPLQSRIEITEEYDEYILTADLLFTIFGVSLQAEYVWRLMLFQQHGLRSTNHIVLSGAAASEHLYHPSNIGWGVYGLLSWELPLERWIQPMQIIPYVMYEHNEYQDTLPAFNFDMVFIGLNFKPSPFVVLKVEYSFGIPENIILYGDNVKVGCAQLAVSF